MDILIDSAVKNSQDIKKVELSAAFLDENIFISVTSYGTGIIEYDIKQIFERKYRVEQEIPNSDADTGLFTAKSIVEAHGGRIWAENQPEQGSRIIFTIPLSE
jgi:two-component system sensor histidine kinase KdpD